ncbi:MULTISPECIES: hypothetical protein [Flavobacterium]|uniref:hypothetical protein n=1 Tax=Flavobacterium TaxID=237 RepID=UPI001F09D212|nr:MULTISPECIES: hypothetical protein [Flavobacterium]MCJ1805948.1 hypothetical protein [Flavobacterium covae]
MEGYSFFKKITIFFLFTFTLTIYAQDIIEIQKQNARATGYAIIASKNPNVDFSVIVILWDGQKTLEENANNQINGAWHAQCAVKGNYFDQAFDASNSFTFYSSVATSQAQFDLYKSTGTKWWIVCSTLPPFSSGSGESFSTGHTITSYSPLLKLKRDTETGGYIQGVQTQLKNGTNNWFFGNWDSDKWLVSKGDYQNPKLMILENGNVGIGTNNPTSKLFVKGVGNYSNTLTLQSPNAVQSLDVLAGYRLTGNPEGVREDVTMTLRSSGSLVGNIAFATGNQEHMRLTQGGNVGIGTTAPSQKLQVENGNINIRTSSNEGPSLILENPSKTQPGTADKWSIYNMTGLYGNSLQFWNYGMNGSYGSRMTISDDGRVSIGINKPDQNSRLHLKDGDLFIDNGSIRLNDGAFEASRASKEGPFFSLTNPSKGGAIGTTWKIYNMTGEYGNSLQFWNYSQNNGSSLMTILDEGDVGVGTKKPLGDFHVGDNTGSGIVINNRATGVASQIPAQLAWAESGVLGQAGDLIISPRTDISGSVKFYTNNGIDIAERFKISGKGDAALKGKFEAKEIKVTTSPTADFVFADNYALPKLEEVEKHIKDKKHLPEIASAKEMEKEGVNVGEFQIKLLQKIEELTLYVIEQNKKIKALEEQIKQVKTKK